MLPFITLLRDSGGRAQNKSSSKQTKPRACPRAIAANTAAALTSASSPPRHTQSHAATVTSANVHCSPSWFPRVPTASFSEWPQPAPTIGPTSQLSKVLQRHIPQTASASICCSLRHPWSPACWIIQPVPAEASASQTSNSYNLHRSHSYTRSLLKDWDR